MPASLTKPPDWCKKPLLLFFLTTGVGAQPPQDTSRQPLRECIATATTATAINRCETTWQTGLIQRIQALGKAIAKRLDTHQRLLFEQNIAAWQTFMERERKMIELSTRHRRDGLGPQLRSGAISQLYEQRERQLREHLHNLTTGTYNDTSERQINH